jgi:hypothetical protein
VHFESQIDWKNYEARRRQLRNAKRAKLPATQIETLRKHAFEPLTQSVSLAATSLQARLPRNCKTTLTIGNISPFFRCEANYSEFVDIGRLDEVIRAFPEFEPSEVEAFSSCSGECPLPDPLEWSIEEVASDNTTQCVNNEGFYAGRIGVGQMESYHLPSTSNPHWTMDFIAQDDTASDPLKYTPYCGSQACGVLDPGGIKGSGHATSVAGFIGSEDPYYPARFGAANARLFFANGGWDQNMDGDGNIDNVQIDTEIGNLEWLVTNDVPILNRSYSGLFGMSSRRAYLFDWFARMHDMIIVQAAGNFSSMQHHNDNAAGLDATCEARNTLCVGAYDGKDPSPGGEQDTDPNGNDEFSWYTRYKNPDDTDREEPDVLSPGHEMQVLWADDTQQESCSYAVPTLCGHSGTSLAAPSIAGMAALALEHTGERWPDCRKSEWFRAIARASAIDHNRFGVPEFRCDSGHCTARFSEVTPRFGAHDLFLGANSFEEEDDLHGAGAPKLNRMLGWTCPDPSDAWITPSDMVPVGADLPALPREHPVRDEDPSEGQQDVGFTYRSGADGFEGEQLPGGELAGEPAYCAVDRGTGPVELRRVVFEWSSCPNQGEPQQADDIPESDVPLASDFNLALETPSGDAYWMSTSFDENYEMFEFCATEDEDYKIHFIPSEEDWGCGHGGWGQGEFMYAVESRTRNIDPDVDCPELEHRAYGISSP